MIFLNMAFRAVSYGKTIILRLFLAILQVWYDLPFRGDNHFCINMVIFTNKGDKYDNVTFCWDLYQTNVFLHLERKSCK